jgi:ATP-dependent DNA ligase
VAAWSVDRLGRSLADVAAFMVDMKAYGVDLYLANKRSTRRLRAVERCYRWQVYKPGLQFNGHDTGDGEVILKHAGKLGFEGVVSKTIDAPYTESLKA